MTTAGWWVMSSSIGLVIALTGYCFYRIVATVRPEDETEQSAPTEQRLEQRAESASRSTTAAHRTKDD